MSGAARRVLVLLGRLHAILGGPGLMIGVVALLAFASGLVVLAREYNRPRATGREAVRQVVAHWVRTPDYLGNTLVDGVALWHEASPDDRPARRLHLDQVLGTLGGELDRQAERFPWVRILSLRVKAPGGRELASWVSTEGRVEPMSDHLVDTFSFAELGADVPGELGLRYRLAPALARDLTGLEVSYRRLLLGVLGLSGFPLLCLVYMVLNARALAERVAREAAQEATLDLADRTCHELGNGAFVLTNEKRNLTDHLDLLERFIAEEPAAQADAARRAGLDADTTRRLHHALKRAYAARGIDPDLELRASAALARHVCRQIDVGSQYISLTVRELDGFLKRSALPVSLGRVDVGECFEETVALLRPRLDASGAAVTVAIDAPGDAVAVRADRRLLIHALVNLVKNALESVESAGGAPRIVLSARVEGRTAWLGVADNGPGVPPEALRRIFDDGYSTKGPGRGRGLAIVRESIHLQEGRIAVDNLPDGGARFLIGLDLDTPDRRRDREPPAAPTPSP